MMLPDFPTIKTDLERLLQLGAREQAVSMSKAIVRLPRRPVYEGDRYILVRENGETVEDTYDTVSAEDSLEVREVETLSLRQAFEMYTGLMGEMDTQEVDAFIKLGNKEAESRDQVVDGAGRPHPETILEAVERMELGSAPRDVDHLFLFQEMRFFLQELDDKAIESARENLKQEPYKDQMEHLLKKKREEFRARESRRKLVG